MNLKLFEKCVAAIESIKSIEDPEAWLTEALRNPSTGHGFNMADEAGIVLTPLCRKTIKAVMAKTVMEGDPPRVQAGNIFMTGIVEYVQSTQTEVEELGENLDSE